VHTVRRVSKLFVGLALVLEACLETSPGTSAAANAAMTPEISLAVDRGSYVIGGSPADRMVIVATFTNGSARTVFLATCGMSDPRFVIERKVGDAWARSFDRFCQLQLGPPLTVPSGATRVDSLVVSASMSVSAEIDPTSPQRLVYGASWDGALLDSASVLPERSRTSAPFFVRTR
jgi:hypothetical protein